MEYQDVYNIAELCVKNVHAETIVQIAKNESNLNEFAVNVNGIKKTFSVKSKKEALKLIKFAQKQDKTFDVGLMQINSKNIERFGISFDRAFDPCLNIKMGAVIISEFYQRALKKTDDPQLALQYALSGFNTGSFSKGFKNGYVKKFYKNVDVKTKKKIDTKIIETNQKKSKSVWVDTAPKVSVDQADPLVRNDWREFLSVDKNENKETVIDVEKDKHPKKQQ